ncbi:probable iron/ascorbate oxidoreductase DDB_G0283291 [Bradysia coprophila]|uniref:probable iron/ascorbate oxidoreductase DDB_G0283291 n=1 Tax=Bradysia coprophila TaxID=38358 RepID=UPI00187DB6A7|nr:probable iron/ascorbate oxidoreductase DDB_G0283291 [Bradysia coprophila]
MDSFGGENHIPIIDISELVSNSPRKCDVAKQINSACREYGFFYVTNHGVSEQLENRLESLSRQFFAQSVEVKSKIRMDLGGRAWRGYFPVGGELTSGRPDMKEGIYFGAELDEMHPLVQLKTPLHGSNLFPDNIAMFKETVLEYIDAMIRLGHIIMAGVALSLNLHESYFAELYTKNPLPLFRIFNYPARNNNTHGWGVGEHTDYGILTILKQDNLGGLQVKSKSRWIEAPPVAGTFVCNIGDMLERMTAGLYKSTPHRVKSPAESQDRLSFPFFFDPNFHGEVKPIELLEGNEIVDDSALRWDNTNVFEFKGTYGEYLLDKVSKVFPQLREEVL